MTLLDLHRPHPDHIWTTGRFAAVHDKFPDNGASTGVGCALSTEVLLEHRDECVLSLTYIKPAFSIFIRK